MSDIEARREARRQRILNNSASRLKKILGETNEETVLANHGAAIKRQELLLNEQNSNSSSDVLRTCTPHSSNYNTHNNLKRSTDDIQTQFGNLQRNSKQHEAEIVDIASRFRVRKYLVIILAVMVRCLLLVCETYAQNIFRTNITDLHLNNIFIPFLAYEVVEFAYFRLPVQKNNFLTSILYLRFKAAAVDRVIVIFDVVSKLSQDLLLYFFAFVVCSYLIDSRTLER